MGLDGLLPIVESVKTHEMAATQGLLRDISPYRWGANQHVIRPVGGWLGLSRSSQGD